ncbi:hypothetical protein JMUB6875_10590 [Nocardia sp. JMUB6875]|uniref:DUF6545 domain-containing protein n=1 Tax=Nocardia sp. JMUB6875 TaxID=3158170 RepID=UPI0032E7A936
MAQFSAVMGLLIFLGMLAAIWQLPPQGARGQRVPIIVLGLFCLGYLLITPSLEALFAAVRVNSAYLVSQLCMLGALALSSLYWLDYLATGPPSTRRRALATRAMYGTVAVVLVALFATSPQQPNGMGFGYAIDGSPRMRIFWVIQAITVIHALLPLARAAIRAHRRERSWRRRLLAALTGVTVGFIGYELWVVLVVTLWPAMPPVWARNVTTTLQITCGALLVVGTIGPVVAGAVRGARIALSYLEQLEPLHHWLLERYPQIRFQSRMSLRIETRITEMLVEISDGLRLLQRDAPAVAASHSLDHETIRTMVHDDAHHAAYELAAAALFRSRAGSAQCRGSGRSGGSAGKPSLTRRNLR